jgi:hypothetical protein
MITWIFFWHIVLYFHPCSLLFRGKIMIFIFVFMHFEKKQCLYVLVSTLMFNKPKSEHL